MNQEPVKEIWKDIPEFSNYQISNLGRIYNYKRDCFMQTSDNGRGNLKITLLHDDRYRYTRSVAQIVGEAFVSPPNGWCDQIAVLDGNFYNMAAENLVWRPRWYVWKYTHQLKENQPIKYTNTPVLNVTKNIIYNSIIEAGMIEGLLFDDIWQSTYTGYPIFFDSVTFNLVIK